MNKLMYLMFSAIFVLDWNIDIFPRVFTWAPEMISGLVAVIVITKIATTRRLAIQPKFLLFFTMLSLLVVAGLVANMVQPGAIFAGIRNYAKHIPIFLLPAVYDFSDKEIKNQLSFLLILTLFQVPLAIFQRVEQFTKGIVSGDAIGGTLGNSKTLSITLLCSITIMFAFYLKGRIGFKRFLVAGLLLFIPSTINETAGTLFLIPLGFLAPVLFADLGKSRMRYMIATIVGGSLFLVIFIGIYNLYFGSRWGGSITNLLTTNLATTYESRETVQEDVKQLGPSIGKQRVGRFAAVELAVHTLWRQDPVKALIGVGIGNASKSFSRTLQGGYYDKYKSFGIEVNTLSRLLWEVGFLGTGLFLLFFYLVFQEARVLCVREDIAGGIALGWIGVLAILLVSTVYINMITPNVIAYLFAYISGYVSAKRSWLADQERKARRVLNGMSSNLNAVNRTA